MAISTINVRLKESRQALGLSQRAFCRVIYLSQSFYAQLEGGTKSVNDRIVELIVEKHHINKEWLVTGKGTMFGKIPPDPQMDQLVEIFKELDPLFKEYIIQQIDNLLQVQKKQQHLAEPEV